MSLLKSVILLDVMKVVTTDYDRSLHFHLFNDSRQNTTTDADVSRERTFLVDVVAVNCL